MSEHECIFDAKTGIGEEYCTVCGKIKDPKRLFLGLPEPETRRKFADSNRKSNSEFKKKPEPRKIRDVIRDVIRARAENIELDDGKKDAHE